MNKKTQVTTILFISLCLTATTLFAQRIPDPNVGEIKLRRQGTMDGNLVRTIFINWGELAHWPDSPSGEWPKGSGHQYVDGVALVVQAATDDNNGQRIHPLETQYREFVDLSPNGELWGWAPLPGYFNPKHTKPAISNDTYSWPSSWPDKIDGWINPNEFPNDYDDDGNGLTDDLVFWNGFFGKGVFNADVETFFVFDDDPDEEWDFYPDPTDTTRRGLGLEVAARYFQWSQVLAEDVIFAVYFITNEGKTDYDSTYYSFYIDWGVGGTDDSSDDTGDYDTVLDIAWAWDFDGIGTPGDWSPVGVAGFAFLESPGIDNDNIDNDEDGLLNENRTSQGPGIWLDEFPYGVYDVDRFRDYYKREPGPHWSNDEDGDWTGFLDINDNGQWDQDEPLNDDVGEDGLGPNDFGYSGPDFGEADGMPSPGEPNFDFLDKDEADQIGLTGFRIFPVHLYELWNENQNWGVFRSAPPPHSQKVTANLGMFFSSGPFPLYAGDTQNYSMALLFGEDKDDLVLTKNTIQQIYNADYRFAKPPDKPKLLSVIPGDQKVTLVWDKRAENSWDPFLQEYDFEGYRIYRSTEPFFEETRLITDAYGRLTFRKPLVQFDLINDIQGIHPIDLSGAHFNLGDNTGLKNVYVDNDVKNGQTYYYAIVSYDRGLVDTSITGELVGLPPSECTSKIDQDISGKITLDINTTEVIPRAPAAGYVTPGLEGDIERETIGTGDVELEFLFADSIKDGHTYSVEFGDSTYLNHAGSPFYVVYDITNDQHVPLTDTLWIDGVSESPLVDGFTLRIYNDETELNFQRTGWVIGNTTYRWRISLDTRIKLPGNELLSISYPADYEITFSDAIVDTAVNRVGFPPQTPAKFTIYNLTEEKDANFQFIEYYEKDNMLSPLQAGQNPDSIEGAMIWMDDPDPNNPIGVRTTWRFYFEADEGLQTPPQDGDVFRLVTLKPFRDGDKITFTVRGEDFDREKAKADMDKIYVVPNPYLAAASWEPRSPFKSGRGERKIYFMNLPPICTIRVYTIRGYLVDTIEHNGGDENGAVPWNMLSKDGQEIAYGIYIYHVDAPGIGEKIGKFAVIK
jgi:hypothetical protein